MSDYVRIRSIFIAFALVGGFILVLSGFSEPIDAGMIVLGVIIMIFGFFVMGDS